MRPLEEVASGDGIFAWPLSLCPVLHLPFTRKPPSLHPVVIVICLHPWGQATAGCAMGQSRFFLPQVVLSRDKGGNCVFSRAPFPSQTLVHFLKHPPNLHCLTLSYWVSQVLELIICVPVALPENTGRWILLSVCFGKIPPPFSFIVSDMCG